MVKMMKVKNWTLLTLIGRHLGYETEGAGPPTYFQTCGNGARVDCAPYTLKVTSRKHLHTVNGYVYLCNLAACNDSAGDAKIAVKCCDLL